jgi:tetratricopeptide (TPR) repeat protein
MRPKAALDRRTLVRSIFCIALLLISLSTAAPACKESPRSAPAAASSTPASPADSPDARARKLALAAAHEDAPVDRLIAQLQTAANKQPTKLDWWIRLGHAWVRKARESADPGYYLNADACATVALALSPDDGLAADLRALVLLNDHKFDASYALAKRVVSEHPDDPMGYGTLSDALLELGRFDEAAAAVQRMVDLKPNLPSYSRASYIRWLEGDTANALDFARRAADAGRDPRNPEPHAWVVVQSAMLFWHQGDYLGADAGFDLALGEVSGYAPALVGKGRIALATGSPARAAEFFERAYEESPLVETAWLLGDARAQAGDAKGAEDAYEHVEREGKLNDSRTLSLFWSTKGKKERDALGLAENEKKVRGDVYTDDALAWALYRNGRTAEAKVAIDRALSNGTKDARLIFHSGAIRIALGDAALGRKLVKDALALNPKFDVSGAREAQGLLGAGDAGPVDGRAGDAGGH